MGAQAKRQSKYPPKLRPRRPLPKLPQVALQWVSAWAVAGLATGILLMLLKALPFAESGIKPTDGGFALWIPGMALAGAAAGLGVGLLYAGLMIVTEEWRNGLEGDTLTIRLGPQVMCGAAAGLVAGVLAGGLGGSVFFAFLGACTAAALNWRSARGA
jgi:hypothetical protein